MGRKRRGWTVDDVEEEGGRTLFWERSSQEERRSGRGVVPKKNGVWDGAHRRNAVLKVSFGWHVFKQNIFL